MYVMEISDDEENVDASTLEFWAKDMWRTYREWRFDFVLAVI